MTGSLPLDRKYRVDTPFGKRGNWTYGYHTGVDYPAPKGTPFYAVYSGTIVSIGGWGNGYGKHVILYVVGRGYYGYCHASKIHVYKGQSVVTGQILGEVGATGRAKRNQLHLELRVYPYKADINTKNPIPTLMRGIDDTPTSSIVKVPTKGSTSARLFATKALTRSGGSFASSPVTSNEMDGQMVDDFGALIYWCCQETGVAGGMPRGVAGQFAYIKKKKMFISVSEALKTRGALLFLGESYVGISLGNGKTVEATKQGVRVMNGSNRGWTTGALVPDLRY